MSEGLAAGRIPPGIARVAALVRLDAAFLLRGPMFWTWIALIALMSWAFSTGELPLIHSGDSAVGGRKLWVSSEFTVSTATAVMALLFHTFFITVLCGLSVMRDEESRIGEILHATPLSPGEYVWGKFLAVSNVCGIALTAQAVLMAFFNHLLPHNTSPELHGPFALSHYLRPLIVFSVPLIVFLGGIAFAVGERTRRAVLIFVLPFALLLADIFLLGRAGRNSDAAPWIKQLIYLADPTGFGWLRYNWLDRDRGVSFYNSAHIPFSTSFLISRLVLILLGFGAVAWSRARFTRSLRNPVRPTQARPPASDQPPVPWWEKAAPNSRRELPPLATLQMSAGPRFLLTQTLTVARAEARALMTQPGLYLFLPLIVLFTVASALSATGMLNTPLLLTAGTLAVSQSDTLVLFTCLLLMVYTVEALDRERTSGFAVIRNALPVRTAGLLAGKFLALCLIPLLVTVSCGLVSLLVLAGQGRVPVTPGPFFLVWGLLLAPTFALWIAFVMAAFAVTGQRAGAYVLGLILLVVYSSYGDNLTWAGNFFLTKALHWSDLSVLELDRRALLLNRIMTLGMALFYGVVATRAFSRRERDPARFVSRLRPLPVLRTALFLLPFAVVPGVATWVLSEAVGHGFQGESVKKAYKDYWRRNLNTWDNASLPGLSAADIAVELYPDRRAFQVQGTYTIVNRQVTPLTQIPITCGFQWTHLHWTLNGRSYTPENHSGLYVVEPSQPLAHGATLRLGFSYDAPDHGISRAGGDVAEFVLPSAVVLTSFGHAFVPKIGYDSNIGVDDDNSTEPPDISSAAPDSGPRDPLFGAPTPFHLHLAVTAPSDFTVNSVGTKVRETVKNGRRTVIWESPHLIPAFNLVGGRWRVSKAPGVSVYYNPAHATNVPEMLAALSAARRYYSEWYAPYPDIELKLSEFPALAGYAQGFPTNISFSEEMGFLTQTKKRAGAAFAVTAHEAAHQWWGDMVVPGDGPGGNVLSEGMAEFSAAALLGQVRGKEARKDFMEHMETEYLELRRVDGERPLTEIDGAKDGDQTVTYEKGGWAFYMLARTMGWHNAQAGFQAFLATRRGSPDHPVLTDFLTALRPFAPDKAAFDSVRQQWFQEIVLPEYRLSSVRRTAERRGGIAGWRVTARLENVGTGQMPVEVKAWGKTADAKKASQYPGRQVVQVGEDEPVTIVLHCQTKPTTVVVDPDVHILQLGRDEAYKTLD